MAEYKVNYCDVVVDAPSDPTIKYFTYQVPQNISKDIAIGQLVLVPFGQKEVKGYVIGLEKKIKEKTNFEIREISRILYPTPLILPKHIAILHWISWYYHAPMIDCIKLFVLEVPKRQLVESPPFSVNKPKRQKIILVPNIAMIPSIIKDFKLPKGIIIHYYDLTLKEKFNAWKSIHKNHVRFIIGSRSAIFVPSQKISEIEILQEHEDTYKDERSPYYHSSVVAAKLASENNSRLILESETPRVETTFLFGGKVKNRNVILKRLDAKLPTIKTRLIDMADELKRGNRTPVSFHLRYLLIQNTKQGKKSLLFLNKKKESGQVFCLNCRSSYYSAKPPLTCSFCQSQNLKFYTLNIYSLANLVKELVPGARIGFVAEGEKDYSKANILISTQEVFNRDLKNFDLVAQIAADTILNLPDFRSSERTFQNIWYLKKLVKRNGDFVIQTYNPTHPATTLAIEGNYQKFYEQEIKERKALSFPPFSTLAKISIDYKNNQKASEESQKLLSQIQAKIIENNLKIEALGPIQSFSQAFKGDYRYNIILKSKKREWLDPVLDLIKPNYRVEVDPLDLL